MNTDRQWERFGRIDPYFGVLSNEAFRGSRLTDAARLSFFQIGERRTATIFQMLRQIDPEFRPERTLDFGCGVGRLLIPLSRESTSAVGVDVSPGMLAEASSNVEKFNIENAQLAHSVNGEFDLIHSWLVFQHIAPRRGLRILRDLISRVRPGGMFVLQIPISCDARIWFRSAVVLKRRVPGLYRVANLARGLPIYYPAMTMYCYALPPLLLALRDAGMEDVRISTTPLERGGYSSAIIYANRPREGRALGRRQSALAPANVASALAR